MNHTIRSATLTTELRAILREELLPTRVHPHTYTHIRPPKRWSILSWSIFWRLRIEYDKHSYVKMSMWYGTLIMYAYSCIAHLPPLKINVSRDLRAPFDCIERTHEHIFSRVGFFPLLFFSSLFLLFFFLLSSFSFNGRMHVIFS